MNRTRPGSLARPSPALLAVALGLLILPGTAAAGVKVAAFGSLKDFLAGDSAGTGVTHAGRLTLGAPLGAPAWPEEAADAVVLGAATDRSGRIFVATGGGLGRLFVSTPDGKVSLLFQAPEPNVTAVAVAADGTVVCGTSPNGRIYRVDPGAREPARAGTDWGSPGEESIWSLAFGPDGALFAGTGNRGRVWRRDRDGKLAMLAELPDTHVRVVAAGRDGKLLAGTSEKGLLVEIAADGSFRTLHDFARPEVTGIAVGADGTVWAAASSTAPPAPAATRGDARGRSPVTPAPAPPREETPKGSVSVSTGPARLAPASAAATPPAEGATDVVAVGPTGLVEPAWTLPEETVYSLRLDGGTGALVLATGPRGRVYTLRDRKLTLVAQTQETQVVSAPETPAGLAAVTMSSAAVRRPPAPGPRAGTFTSATRDAGRLSRFGRLRFDGEVPAGSSLKLSVRSGNSSGPDASWSPWALLGNDGTAAGPAVPPARYFQWRVEMSAGAKGGAPSVERVELSYAETNSRPVLENLQVLEPGLVYAKSGAASGPSVLSIASPDELGIFAGLEPAREPAGPDGGGKKLYRKGFRTVSWKGTDLNGDLLRYDLDLLPSSSGPALPLRRDVEDSWFSFDTSALPDGRYRCRVTVSDRVGNAEGEDLSATEETELFVVDNSPPALAVSSARSEKESVVLTVSATDALSPVVKAEGAVNADRWRVLSAEDGVADSLAERFLLRVPRPAGPSVLAIRVVDASGNSAALAARYPEDFR